MLLKRRKNEDKSVSDRQKIISYKKFFSSDEGKDVLCDLFNKCHGLTQKELTPFQMGQLSVLNYIMTQNAVDLAVFERLLRGELN